MHSVTGIGVCVLYVCSVHTRVCVGHRGGHTGCVLFSHSLSPETESPRSRGLGWPTSAPLVLLSPCLHPISACPWLFTQVLGTWTQDLTVAQVLLLAEPLPQTLRFVLPVWLSLLDSDRVEPQQREKRVEMQAREVTWFLPRDSLVPSYEV